MKLLKKYNLTWGKILKIAGMAAGALIGLIFIVTLLDSFTNLPQTGMSGAKNLDYESVQSQSAMPESAEDLDEASLSLRNISPEESTGGGSDSEEYEVTEYEGLIETRRLEETCSTISGLKAKDYVIFENSNEYDKGCNYRFKVKKQNAEEILAIVESLDPKELSESIYTIKKQIEDFTSELEILERKKQSVEETLETAISAYDSITNVATQGQDAESLAKIIDSKIKIIERLTQERIKINAQIDRYGRLKSEQLDRLEYTYFHLSIRENKYIDLDDLKDSWQHTIKNFVLNINKIAQDITVNLVALILFLLQYAIYLLIVIIVAKYGWQLAKYIWKK